MQCVKCSFFHRVQPVRLGIIKNIKHLNNSRMAHIPNDCENIHFGILVYLENILICIQNLFIKSCRATLMIGSDINYIGILRESINVEDKLRERLKHALSSPIVTFGIPHENFPAIFVSSNSDSDLSPLICCPV